MKVAWITLRHAPDGGRTSALLALLSPPGSSLLGARWKLSSVRRVGSRPLWLSMHYFSLLKADVGQLKHFACRPITLSLSFTKRVTCHILKGPGRKGRKRDRVKSSFRYGGNYGPAYPNSQVNNFKNDAELFTDSRLLSERLQHKPSLLHLLGHGF